ncbi:MAG TPA: extracellular solute-binding protein [Virgibacillus sp.]|nr:extracellular solute-binding protein [Virgibacillus sp.]
MRSKKIIKSLMILLFVSIPVILSACADAEDSIEEEDGVTTITFMSRWPEINSLLTEELIPEFEEEHPDIKVKQVSYSSHGNYVKALQSAVNGDDLPDFFANHPKMPTYQLQSLGLLHELDDIIGDKKDDFEEGMWTQASTTMDDKIYSFPIFSNKKDTILMYYNKDVLEEAGLTEDDIPETWDELVDVSEQIRDKTDAYGTYLELNYWTIEFLVNEMASTITPEVVSTLENTNIDYKEGEYNYNTEGTKETIKFLASLVEDGLDEPSDISRSEAQGPGVLSAGKAAFLFSGGFASVEMDEEGFEDYGVAPIPTKDGEKKQAQYSGAVQSGGFHVAKDTENYEEVKMFFEFLMDRGYTAMVEEGVGYPPIPAIEDEADNPDTPSWDALTQQNHEYELYPDAVMNNEDAYKVKEEMSGKGTDQNVGDVARGYIKGQIKEGELEDELQKMTDKQNEAFKEAIKNVQDDGVDIDQSDWVFPDWEPGEPYDK